GLNHCAARASQPHGKRTTETELMSGDTGQLQKLTDEQVNARLSAYNGDGSLDRDIALLRENAADLIIAEVLADFGQERADRYAPVYAGKADAAWIQLLAGYGRAIYAEKTPVPVYMVEHAGLGGRVITKICERFVEDPAMLAQCVAAFHRIEMIETDITLAQVSLLQ